ncbi:MAG TPA: hypothetical protein PK064_06310, partial [Bacteroidales bacterium]|nr:hypothetical protein [Bacteroidales bacterium]
EPAQPFNWPQDFKSCVSTYSTIRANKTIFSRFNQPSCVSDPVPIYREIPPSGQRIMTYYCRPTADCELQRYYKNL